MKCRFFNVVFFFKNRNKIISVIKNEGLNGIIKRLKYSKSSVNSRVSTKKKPNNDILDIYIEDRFNEAALPTNEKSSYVPKSIDAINIDQQAIKLIAYYLPQFHPFPENDFWWGKGFTEWTNVTKANPQFLGHRQPQLPGELGFYDLRLPIIMKQQIELAKQYGIYGFCFHHYWFSGKRLMETVVNNFLADPSLNINFCLCWANENWTRRWDGAENDVLIAQNHSPEDDEAFFYDILPALKDSRYITIDHKPILIVYRPSLFPAPKETTALWRKLAKENGLPGLYLMTTRAFGCDSAEPFDFDGIVEFPPHNISASLITEQCKIINPNFQGMVYDYGSIEPKYYENNDNYFYTVMPSWDNEARKPGKGSIFHFSTPEKYADWLTKVCSYTLKKEKSKQFVFINAWNEWAEGAHLEPDRYYGYAYLHATANVLRNLNSNDKVTSYITEKNKKFKKTSNTALVFHVYYTELFDELLPQLNIIKNKCDIFITIRADISIVYVEKIYREINNIYCFCVQNRGRDILPFIHSLKEIKKMDYEYIGKIHTKRSPHITHGDMWREELISFVLQTDKNGVLKAVDYMKSNPKIGLLCGKDNFIDLSIPDINVDNRIWLNKLLSRMNREDKIGTYDTFFPAGSMYWCRTAAICNLLNIVNIDEFELETGQLDGTLAHSVERIMGILVEETGYICEAL